MPLDVVGVTFNLSNVIITFDLMIHCTFTITDYCSCLSSSCIGNFALHAFMFKCAVLWDGIQRVEMSLWLTLRSLFVKVNCKPILLLQNNGAFSDLPLFVRYHILRGSYLPSPCHNLHSYYPKPLNWLHLHNTTVI